MDRVDISYDGSNTVSVVPGRGLRLTGEVYPLFRPPDPASVSDPDACLDFLKTLHLSLCPVFDIRLRRWMGAYFDAVRVWTRRLPIVPGAMPPTARSPTPVSRSRARLMRFPFCCGWRMDRWRSFSTTPAPVRRSAVLSSGRPNLRPRPKSFCPHWAATSLHTGAMSPPRGTRLCAAPFRGCAGNGSLTTNV